MSLTVSSAFKSTCYKNPVTGCLYHFTPEGKAIPENDPSFGKNGPMIKNGFPFFNDPTDNTCYYFDENGFKYYYGENNEKLYCDGTTKIYDPSSVVVDSIHNRLMKNNDFVFDELDEITRIMATLKDDNEKLQNQLQQAEHDLKETNVKLTLCQNRVKQVEHELKETNIKLTLCQKEITNYKEENEKLTQNDLANENEILLLRQQLSKTLNIANQAIAFGDNVKKRLESLTGK